MEEILGTIGSAIGSIFDNPVVKFGFQIFVIYWAILWLAAAVLGVSGHAAPHGQPDRPVPRGRLRDRLHADRVPARGLHLQDRPAAGADRRGLRAQPRRGGDAGRDRGRPPLSDLRSDRERRVDHLPDLPHPAESRLPELLPARRASTGHCAPGAAGTSNARRSSARATISSADARSPRLRRAEPTLRSARPFGRQRRGQPRLGRARARSGDSLAEILTDATPPTDGSSAPAEDNTEDPGSTQRRSGPPAAGALPAATSGSSGSRSRAASAPGLFVAGWIALVIGGSAAFIGLLAGQDARRSAALRARPRDHPASRSCSSAGPRRSSDAPPGQAYAGPAPILAFSAVVVGWYLGAIVAVTPLQLLHVAIEGPALSLLGGGNPGARRGRPAPDHGRRNRGLELVRDGPSTARRRRRARVPLGRRLRVAGGDRHRPRRSRPGDPHRAAAERAA